MALIGMVDHQLPFAVVIKPYIASSALLINLGKWILPATASAGSQTDSVQRCLSPSTPMSSLKFGVVIDVKAHPLVIFVVSRFVGKLGHNVSSKFVFHNLLFFGKIEKGGTFICLPPIFQTFQFLEDRFSNQPKILKSAFQFLISYLYFSIFKCLVFLGKGHIMRFLKFSSVIIGRTKCVAFWQKK